MHWLFFITYIRRNCGMDERSEKVNYIKYLGNNNDIAFAVEALKKRLVEERALLRLEKSVEEPSASRVEELEEAVNRLTSAIRKIRERWNIN